MAGTIPGSSPGTAMTIRGNEAALSRHLLSPSSVSSHLRNQRNGLAPRFHRGWRRFERAPRRPQPIGRPLQAQWARALVSPRTGRRARICSITRHGRPLQNPNRFRVRSRTWRQPLERCRFPANAPFVGLSVTLSRAGLCGLPFSALRAL